MTGDIHDAGFKATYLDLEARMKVLAEADGDVFLPNPEPLGPVESCPGPEANVPPGGGNSGWTPGWKSP
jgi:hypothetical protein